MNGVRAYGLFRTAGGIVSILLLALLLVRVPRANAQFRPRTLSAGVSVGADPGGLIQRPAAGHYDVVALRVEFQPDESVFSTGDGTFDGVLFPGVEGPRIDPLPHDTDYFTAHLSFLENYIHRVSDGRTQVTTHLLPVIVRVSERMARYAPVGLDAASDSELGKLASLVVEAWTRASQLDSFDMPAGIDPDRTAFVLFHAGVGRDVELLGTTLDKTPEDLPSLFFDQTSLDRLLGSMNVSVDGVPITNTLVIPRTETRRGFDFIQDQPFLAEISINGLLAASFLSYLGVPDLFDTATGESAVGPFDVMDGLGIFAFSGLLPPEPSAWTKLYLDWADIQVADPVNGDQAVSLRHSGSASSNDVFIAPIAEDEYFLVENRNRDPELDGLNLVVWRDGEVQTIHFENGGEGFNSRSVEDFPGGVVVDADNLDFALPGGVDNEGVPLIGGALIWHIDQARLAAGLPTNSVNADPRHRAVDLEEADGAQDLGFPSAGFFGPSFDVGSPFDFFYSGNPTVVITSTGSEIRLYENRFGPDTHPGSEANAGGSSFTEMVDFSAPGPDMSFVYRRVAQDGLIPRDDISFSFDLGDIPFSIESALYFVDGPGVDFAAFNVAADGKGRLLWSRGGETEGMLDALFAAEPVQTELGVTAFGPDGFHTLKPDGSLSLTATLPPGTSVIETTTPLVALSNGTIVLGAADQQGPMLLSVQSGVITVERRTETVRGLAVVDGNHPVIVSAERTEIPSLDRVWSYATVSPESDLNVVFARSGEHLTGVVSDPTRNQLVLLKDDGTTRALSVSAYASLGVEGTLHPSPVIADLDGDGSPDNLFSAGRWLVAVNGEGAVVKGFPVAMREPAAFQPLLLTVSEGDLPIVLIPADDGRIDAYDLGARTRDFPGFPIPAASALASAPILNGNGLMALSTQGRVTRFDFQLVQQIIWGSARGDSNSGFVDLSVQSPGGGTGNGGLSGRLLVPNETYNWPNPIRDGVTWIRFMPSARSDIEITIVDLAGQLIERLEYFGAAANVATEMQWRTTAGNGVYLARIQATSESGVTDSQLVKMAIVR